MRFFFCYHENDTMSTDAADGIEKAGFKLQRLVIKDGSQPLSDLSLLKKVIDFKTDLFFALNQFYIAERRDFLSTISSLNIRIALWFIDNPFYFFPFLNMLKDMPGVYIFQWDRFYIDDLKKLGFKNVFYLPQATNPDRFNNIERNQADEKIFSAPVAYAANLDFFRTLKLASVWSEKTGMENNLYLNLLEKAVLEVIVNLGSRTYDIASAVLATSSREYTDDDIYMFAEAVEHRVSQMIRIEYVNALAHSGIRVWGDKKEWQLAKVNADLAGRVSYFNNIPKVYCYSAINLNISRIQQRSGTNQRVFDVPAGGNFLLSDYRQELDEMFEVGSEIILFSNTEDLKEKIEIFRDPVKRKKVSLKGQERVLNEHTYRHRMTTVAERILRGTCQQKCSGFNKEKSGLLAKFCSYYNVSDGFISSFRAERN